jgi:hypothetical protein
MGFLSYLFPRLIYRVKSKEEVSLKPKAQTGLC